ncbi:MAG: MBL fold metallo-hydrolase [Promethearchaeota archaeon]
MPKFNITWNGTANIRIEWENSIIFFDPWFSRNEKADPKIDADLNFVDDGACIFISHGHFDHLQDVPRILEAKPNVQVFCSRIAKDAISTALIGKGLPSSEIDSCLSRVTEVHANQELRLDDKNLVVKVIKSEHIKFDFKSIARALLKFGTWKNPGKFVSLAKSFPKGDIFGYDVRRNDADGRIVFFGSLWDKYPEILKMHAGPDLLFLPIAGRFDAAKIGLKITSIMQPKVVIPIHHDDFYPPISYWVPLEDLKKGVEEKFANIRYLELPVGKPFEIEI